MMDRRRFVATVAGAGTVPLAGCGAGIFEVTDDEEQGQTPAQAEQIAAVNDRLRRIFTQLAEYSIVANGDPAIDTATYSDQEIAVLRDELEGAQTALEELSKRSETRTATGSEGQLSSVRVVEQGVMLAAARVEIYDQGRAVAAQDEQGRSAFDTQDFGAIETAAMRVRELTEKITDAAQACAAAANALRSGEGSVPSFYDLEAGQRESTAFAGVSGQVEPAVTGVLSVTDALGRAAAGRDLLANEQYAAASVTYQEAVDAVAAARRQFELVVDSLPMFTATTARARCGLSDLKAALTAAREGAKAGQQGEADRANKQLTVARDALDTYRSTCAEV